MPRRKSRSNSRYAAFVTLRLPKAKDVPSSSNIGLQQGRDNNVEGSKTEFQAKNEAEEAEMLERELHPCSAWNNSLISSNAGADSPKIVAREPAPQRATPEILDAQPGIYNGSVRTRPILKPHTRRRGQIAGQKSKKVTVNLTPKVLHFSPESSIFPNESNTLDDLNTIHSMSQKPTLKLKLSKTNISQPSPVQTPLPQSATRTPSLKLNFGGASKIVSTPTTISQPKKEKVDGEKTASAKKRKRTEDVQENGEPRPQPIRKLTFKTSKSATAAPTPMIKLKSKGKIPKRPLGVGYDSELEDREVDPVILEGFILRMQPGPDCDYVRNAIESGTIGVHRAQGGADVRMRVLDTQGRRGILIIRQNQYATTLVDLPCVIEGMKSWDKRGFIKSIDISQMMIVLGSCKTDEEARNYPLPDDVDPKTFQYAHGLTAPMKWVRKRRFARTKRARVDDIEAVERRVNALLEADRQAQSTRYQLLDRDPRMETGQYSSDYEDDDAEGEDDDIEPDDYFAIRNGSNTGVVETPGYRETPAEDIGQDEVDEFERMFADEDEPANGGTSHVASGLRPPDQGDSSFAVTSTSASPSATAAPTPASAPEQSSDEDDDEDGGEDDEELDDDEKEGDENLQQTKDRIDDLQQKIKEQTDVLKKTQNTILRKKIAKKIQDLKEDVAMMKNRAGLGGDEDDDE